MKKLLFFIIMLSSMYTKGQSSVVVYSDKVSIDLKEEIPLNSQYLDSLFYRGKVFFKDGKSASSLMNYDLINNGISFVNDEKKLLILDITDDLSSVNYNKRIFLPFNGALLEQIAVFNNISLLLKRKVTFDSSVAGAYGIKSEVSSTKPITTFAGPLSKELGDSQTSHTTLKLDNKITITFEKKYYLLINGAIKPISRIKDLKKQFPQKKDLIINYILDNRLDINNENDLKSLVKFCSEK